MKVVHHILDPKAKRRVPARLCALAVMTKAPRAGQVKTRLTPPLTPEEAAALNRCLLRDTTASISAAVEKGGAQGVGVYTPVGAEDAFADILPQNFDLVLQRGDTFGERLIHAAEDLFELGFAAVCLIDSDSPTVPAQAYAQAVAWLAEPADRMVLGPSDDGGYYLIGINHLQRRVFEEIDWSTERVFEQTRTRAQELGLEVKLLPTWYDVDDRATLRRLCDEVLAGDATGWPAPETRRFLENLIDNEGRERIWPHE